MTAFAGFHWVCGLQAAASPALPHFASRVSFALGQSFTWTSGVPCGMDGRHSDVCSYPHQGACKAGHL